MNEKLKQLNAVRREEAESLLLDCCGSRKWARKMAESRPFKDLGELCRASDEIWSGLASEDWLEAFAAHPRIGSRSRAPSQKDRAAGWSKNEQRGTAAASDTVLSDLEEVNRLYEKKFGYIFIVCATGKDAHEMLGLAQERLKNDPGSEIKIAASEQEKITRNRLEKLFG